MFLIIFHFLPDSCTSECIFKSVQLLLILILLLLRAYVCMYVWVAVIHYQRKEERKWEEGTRGIRSPVQCSASSLSTSWALPANPSWSRDIIPLDPTRPTEYIADLISHRNKQNRIYIIYLSSTTHSKIHTRFFSNQLFGWVKKILILLVRLLCNG